MLSISGRGYQKHKFFPGICDAKGAALSSLKSLMFLYSLLKSAATNVLMLTSAVLAIAHVRSVSIKSLSVTTMLFE